MSLIALFTDFGWQGPYVGLVKLAVARYAPQLSVIDLLHDAPAFDIQCSAYLLAAYAREFPAGAVFIAVVDPGVGGERAPVIVRADERWYVGPDNGLFDRVTARAGQAQSWRIVWRPARLSASFHGRDLFAPVAAMLAANLARPDELGEPMPPARRNWPDELARIIYIDRYGNLITGVRAQALDAAATVIIAGRALKKARTFADNAVGEAFWYENSSGLVELAVNQGSAADRFGARVGNEVGLSKQSGD